MSTIKTVKPHQLAWLRRRELESMGFEVWEMPNGDLWHHDTRYGPLRLQVMPREATTDKPEEPL